MKKSFAPNPSLKYPMRSSRLRSDGFVLVAVLLVIALAVVLVVTTSSVSQIERKAISNSANQEIARQNALFALNLAVSQLQVAAGPDQRVTATADILNTNSSILSPIAQPSWTGVWKSYNPSWTNIAAPWFRPEPLDIDTNGNVGTATTTLRLWSTNSANVTWLVSGATNNTTISPLSSTLSWMSNSIVLASNWGTGTNGSLTGATWTNSATVTVPLVTITNGATNNVATNVGKYAYWVSDEGVKAKVSLTDTNMSTNAITTVNNWIPSLLHYFAPPAMNVSSVMTNFGITNVLTTDFRSNTNLIKMTSLGGLALITNSVPAFTNNTLAADLTPYSYGVLSDTRMGGLRQDLTAAFESTSANGSSNFTALQARSGTGSGNDAACVFRGNNIAIPWMSSTNLIGNGTQPGNSTILDGMRWQSLYFFYNLYKSTMPQSPSTKTPTLGSAPSGVGTPSVGSSPNAVTVRDPSWVETNTSGNYIMQAMAPVELADRIDTAITSIATNVPIVTGSGTNAVTNLVPGFTFQLRYYPMVVLHNPYAVSLTIPNNSALSVTKAILSTPVTLTSTTNRVTNATWQYITGTTNSPVTNTVGTTNISNLYPYIYAGGTSNNNTTPLTKLVSGLNQVCTNLTTTMAPGEIRVFAMSNNINITNNSLASTFPNLVSSSTTTLDAYNYYNVGTSSADWQGTTNPNDTVVLSIGSSTNNVGHYNTLRYYPYNSATFTAWPGSNNLGGNLTSWALPGILASPYGNTASNTPWTNPTIQGMQGMQVYRILGQFERLKGVNSSSNSSFFSSAANLPLFMGNSVSLNAGRSGPGATTPGNYDMPTTEVYATAMNQLTAFTLLEDATKGSILTTSWGKSAVGQDVVDTSPTLNNNCQLVIHDIPIAPLTSLGQFMHLDDEYFDQNYMGIGIPAMSVGGSFAAPETGLSSSSYFPTNPGTSIVPRIDTSYMANEALFDCYFFSTVPPPSGFNWGSGGYGAFSNSTITATAIAANQPLPNSRLVYYRKNGSNPIVADLQNESKAAANLLLDGAFNVNSTSVAAWKALLGSLAGHTFHTYNYLTGSANDLTPSSLPSGYPYPIPRFWSVSRSTPNDPWEGMRALSDTQLTALATEIVKQVRLRGPFLSIGDFLNRRLGPNNTSPISLVTMGAIQSAIENTQTNGTTSDVNYNIHSSPVGTGNITAYNPNANPTNPPINLPINGVATIVTNSATGIPGYLMQQDIVQAFAPVLTPRSDTFVIRVYGEADKPSTNSVAITYSQAWGEAVVQRLPEYFDQTDAQLASTTLTGYALGDATPPYSSAGPMLNSANQTFGRRFKIVSFRWLNQNEL